MSGPEHERVPEPLYLTWEQRGALLFALHLASDMVADAADAAAQSEHEEERSFGRENDKILDTLDELRLLLDDEWKPAPEYDVEAAIKEFRQWLDGGGL